MGDFNKLILMGRLTADIELRQGKNGTVFAALPMAVNTVRKAGGERREETLYIDAFVFGSQAESACKYLKKGALVLAEGRLHKEDGPPVKVRLLASSVTFLPKAEAGPPAPGGHERTGVGGPAGSRPDPYDDLPF